MLSTSSRFNKQGEGGGAVHPLSANSMSGGGGGGGGVAVTYNCKREKK